MKKLLPGLLLGLVLGAFATWLLLSRHAPPSAETVSPETNAAEPVAADGTVHLSAAQVAAAGLEVAAPHIVTLTPAVEAFGRVLDPAPLIAAAAEVATARAASEASARESARVKSLHDAGENASTQALETAVAAAQRDRILLAAARARLVAAWGPALAAQLDSGQLTPAIEEGWTFARIDVPPGDTPLAPDPKTAHLSLLADPSAPFDAEILGPAPTADAQLQGRGFLALIRDRSLPVGAALHATLPGTGDPAPHPVVPRRALVRHEGSVFVFVQTATDTFARRRIELGQPLAEGVAIASGLDAGDRVVVTGAQQLLSEQLGAGGGED